MKSIWQTAWRSTLVGIGYVLALLEGGIIPGLLGIPMSSAPVGELTLLWVLIAGIVIALFLGHLASRMLVSAGWLWMPFAKE